MSDEEPKNYPPAVPSTSSGLTEQSPSSKTSIRNLETITPLLLIDLPSTSSGVTEQSLSFEAQAANVEIPTLEQIDLPSTSSGVTEQSPSSEAQAANVEIPTLEQIDLPSTSSGVTKKSLSFETQAVNLKTATLEQLESVRNKLYQNKLIKATSCELTRAVSKKLSRLNINCYMKFEMLQYCGTCKARGAAYAVLRHFEKHSNTKRPIVSASLGNFAMALSYYALQYEIPITIVMPKITPSAKVIACTNSLKNSADSNVIIEGDNIHESTYHAKGLAMANDMIYIGEDHPDVIIGQTSVGLDILDNLANLKNVESLRNTEVAEEAEIPTETEYVDAIMVPITTGSLIAGVAMAVKKKNPTTLVIGIVAETSPSFSRSREADEPVWALSNYSILTDELAISRIGSNAFSVANELIDGLIMVTENWIAAAMCQIIEHEGYTVEGSGAMGLAAILYGDTKIVQTKNIKNVVVLVSDGNLDPNVMEKCAQVGLYTQGRLLEFTVQISDQPQSVGNLLRRLTSLGVFLYKVEYHTSTVQITIESKDEVHADLVKQLLDRDYNGWSGFRVSQIF